jgi:hypothetical protein
MVQVRSRLFASVYERVHAKARVTPSTRRDRTQTRQARCSAQLPWWRSPRRSSGRRNGFDQCSNSPVPGVNRTRTRKCLAARQGWEWISMDAFQAPPSRLGDSQSQFKASSARGRGGPIPFPHGATGSLRPMTRSASQDGVGALVDRGRRNGRGLSAGKPVHLMPARARTGLVIAPDSARSLSLQVPSRLVPQAYLARSSFRCPR